MKIFFAITLLVICNTTFAFSIDSQQVKKIVNGLVNSKLSDDKLEFDWTDSLLTMAIVRCQNTLDIKQQYVDSVIKFYKKHNREKPTITSPDLLAPVIGAIEVTGLGSPLKNVIESAYNFIKTEPVNEIGTLNHIGARHSFHPLLPLTKSFVSDSIWTDSLVMYVVSGMMLAQKFNDDELKIFIRKQHAIFDKFLYDGNLYKHAYFLKDKSLYPSGNYYWLRGNAWVLLSLVELIELESDKEVRAKYERRYKKLMGGLKKYQKEDGLFDTILTTEKINNYPDTSGNSIILYAALKAKRLGVANDEELVRKLMPALLDKVTKKSDSKYVLEEISGPTNAFKYYWYYTRLVGTEENLGYGLGPFILAMNEFVKLEKKGDL